MNYEQALEFIENYAPKEMTLGLEAMTNLLEGLSHPETSLRIVHIAGTNGKGSVGAYLAYILSEAGYKIGRYVSPTILDYRERIQTLAQGEVKYITKESTAEKVTCIQGVMEKLKQQGKKLPTPFEIETAMAFLEFAEKKCDVVLLETGLGGRLDATNAIQNKELALFTSISMDHMGILGNSIEEITKEKAGIIKEETDVVCYDYGTECTGKKIYEVLEKACQKKHANLFRADLSKLQIEQFSWQGTDFLYKGESYHVNLLGENQPYNAVTAIEAAKVLAGKKFRIRETQIKNGLLRTKWPGRFDIVGKNPLLLVDGAHNEDAAYSLKHSLDVYFPGKKLVFIIGIFADKEYEKIVSITAPKAKKIITIASENSRALPSKELMETARKYCDDVEDKKNIKEALSYVQTMKEETVIAFGSLSFLGEVYDVYKNNVEKAHVSEA